MPQLTADERVRYVQAVFETFEATHKVKRFVTPNTEYELARKWAVRGVPLATVLQGIVETGGKPRTLLACERSVEENIERWHQAAGSLRELPEPGPLEAPFDVEAARKRRDEGLALMRKPGDVREMPAAGNWKGGAVTKPTACELLDSICPIYPAKYIERDVEILRERVEAVLALHVRHHRAEQLCAACPDVWPCATIRALDGEEAK